MKVAVVGCAHGEVEKIYETLQSIENDIHCRVDLLLCCGDFQSARDESDLKSMVRTRYYHDMRTFFKYYNGESTAPVLTIFVGGNHETSNYLQELPFGGWVAQNIYYLGYAGCVNVNGLRIAGISGKRRCNFFLVSRDDVVSFRFQVSIKSMTTTDVITNFPNTRRIPSVAFIMSVN